MATEDKDEDLKTEDSTEEIDTGTKPEDETTDDKDEDGTEDDAEADKGDDDSEDDDGTEDGEDDKTDDEDKPEFKKRFTQIKGENADEYLPNLEEAYRNSTTEGQRLAIENKTLKADKDAMASLIANNPDIAKMISDKTGGKMPEALVDPAIMQARQDMEERQTKEYNAFVDKHPDLESDPDLQKKILATLTEFGAAARRDGRILGMDEGLRKAWAFHGLETNSKEDIASKAKENAARGRTTNGGKKPSGSGKGTLTPEQIAVGKKWGLTEQQLIDANK